MLLQPSIYVPPIEMLVSFSPSGEAHDFRLDQVTDLYDLAQKGHYASESEVVFLVIAAPEDKQGKETFVTPDGEKHEVAKNIAEHHDYLLIFDRKGNYKKKVQVDDSFAVQRVGLFPSGTFLALGFDRADRSPRLMLLNDDGSLLKIIAIPKKGAPESMFPSSKGSGGLPFLPAPVQLAPYGDSIIVVQNGSKFPLFVVDESGEIHSIAAKLPEGIQINVLIPSDENLYALMTDASTGWIYELNPQDGSVLRRFQLGKENSDANVACVNDGKFLSFSYGHGKLVRLVGTAEPAHEAGSPPQEKAQ